MKVIDFSSFDKTLLVYPEMDLLQLAGHLCISVEKRSCVGRWEASTYVPCENAQFPTCHQCKPFNACAICSGTCLNDTKTCLEEHVVYLAMFRPAILKIGVSKSSRFERRLKEQGADIGGIITSYPDGEVARQGEHELQQKLNLKNVPISKKMKLETDLDLDVWEQAKKELNVQDEVMVSYFSKPLWMRPISVRDMICGEVVGLKGRMLLFDDNCTLYVCDLQNMLGAHIVLSGAVNRQTSLKSY